MPSRSRPWCVTLVGWLFIVVGGASIVNGIWTAGHGVHGGYDPQSVLDMLLVGGIALVALIGGVLVLCGYAWARWLLVLWMAFHLVLSAMHDPVALLTHAVIFAAALYGLYCPAASAYFRPHAGKA